MIHDLVTQRLRLDRLVLSDAAFILELLNTEGWIAFIGQRNVKAIGDAENYIGKILGNPNVCYWVVSLKADASKIGIISLIKRDYLEHHDIGFAFLPAHSGQGYAFETTNAALKRLLASEAHITLLATTMAENTRSIQLLEKLGLSYGYEVLSEGEKLLVFTTDKA